MLGQSRATARGLPAARSYVSACRSWSGASLGCTRGLDSLESRSRPSARQRGVTRSMRLARRSLDGLRRSRASYRVLLQSRCCAKGSRYGNPLLAWGKLNAEVSGCAGLPNFVLPKTCRAKFRQRREAPRRPVASSQFRGQLRPRETGNRHAVLAPLAGCALICTGPTGENTMRTKFTKPTSRASLVFCYRSRASASASPLSRGASCS